MHNEEKGYFRRSVSFEKGELVYDDAMDSSVYALFEFNIFDAHDPKVVSTMQKMRECLWVKTNVGGIARYYTDY